MNPQTPGDVAPETRPKFWPLGIITAFVTAVAVIPVHRLWDASLRVPFTYFGDANSGAILVKGVLDHGWYATNKNLGAPFVQHVSDYPFSENLHMVLIRLIGLSGASYAVVLNLYYLLGFVLVALAAVWVLRRLGVSPAVAIAISVLYAFLPYHQTRGEGHLFLGAYFVVPFACYLVLRSLDAKPLLTRAPLLTRSNVGILVICVLIGCANQYYAVFTVLLLGLVLAAQACQRLGLARLGSTVVAAVVIAVTLGLNMAPSVLYQRNHGTNTAIEHRNVEDSEKYGLKLTSMLLPREGHRVDLFGRATHKYGEHSPVDSEQGQSLGLIGAAGLTLLLALVVLGPFRRRRDVKDPLEDRLRQLGALVIGIFLLATIGGLSSLIALFVPQIRGWNRISVFLAFFVFFALALLLDEVRARQVLPRAVMRVWPVVLALVVTIGILDSTFDPPPYAPTKAEFASDDVFVHRIERRLGKTAMVFQLPYNPYPESPGLVDQAYYDEARGYLHSSTLRWSYGAVRGRPQGDWQEPLVLGPVRDLLDTVAALGFTGIYVDRFGYGDHGAEIEHQLSALAPGSRLISPNHRLVLYDIRSYAKALKTSEPERVAKLRRSILRLGTS